MNYRGRETTSIAASVANGTLPIGYAELVAHAVCQLDVDATYAADERTAKGIKIRMRFRGHGEAASPQLGPTVGVLSSLDLAMPGIPPRVGERRILMRAFVAIAPDYKLITMFDATGAPILPPKSLGLLRIEQPSTLRIRSTFSRSVSAGSLSPCSVALRRTSCFHTLSAPLRFAFSPRRRSNAWRPRRTRRPRPVQQRLRLRVPR